MTEPLEIERKYLIHRPAAAELTGCSLWYEIEQTYLESPPEVTARVRRRVCDGREERFYTEKERRTDRTCVERERPIDAEEYARLLQRRRRDCRTIRKRRWCLPWEGLLFEIDLYPFWEHLAIMEVELSDEGQEVVLPPQIRVIREVSGDVRLKNVSLAQYIPTEAELL